MASTKMRLSLFVASLLLCNGFASSAPDQSRADSSQLQDHADKIDLVKRTMSTFFSPDWPNTVTIGSNVVTANPSGFAIEGQTVKPDGGAVVISSTTLSLGHSGVLMINNKPTTLHAATMRPSNVIMVGPVSVTAKPTGFVVEGHTVRPGGPPLTLSSDTLSLGSSGILVLNGRKTTLATDPKASSGSSSIESTTKATSTSTLAAAMLTPTLVPGMQKSGKYRGDPYVFCPKCGKDGHGLGWIIHPGPSPGRGTIFHIPELNWAFIINSEGAPVAADPLTDPTPEPEPRPSSADKSMESTTTTSKTSTTSRTIPHSAGPTGAIYDVLLEPIDDPSLSKLAQKILSEQKAYTALDAASESHSTTMKTTTKPKAPGPAPTHPSTVKPGKPASTTKAVQHTPVGKLKGNGLGDCVKASDCGCFPSTPGWVAVCNNDPRHFTKKDCVCIQT